MPGPELELAPNACIVCGKKHPGGENVPGWAYLAGSIPIGAIACSSKCMETAIDRHKRGLRVDGKAKTPGTDSPTQEEVYATAMPDWTRESDYWYCRNHPQGEELANVITRAQCWGCGKPRVIRAKA